MLHERKKHIEIDCHFIRDKTKAAKVNTAYVHTHQQLADILTKGLSQVQHVHLLGKLGVINVMHSSA